MKPHSLGQTQLFDSRLNAASRILTWRRSTRGDCLEGVDSIGRNEGHTPDVVWSSGVAQSGHVAGSAGPHRGPPPARDGRVGPAVRLSCCVRTHDAGRRRRRQKRKPQRCLGFAWTVGRPRGRSAAIACGSRAVRGASGDLGRLAVAHSADVLRKRVGRCEGRPGASGGHPTTRPRPPSVAVPGLLRRVAHWRAHPACDDRIRWRPTPSDRLPATPAHRRGCAGRGSRLLCW